MTSILFSSYHRRRNQINFLINDDGLHITSPFDIHNEFSNFYIKLWSQDSSFDFSDLVNLATNEIPSFCRIISILRKEMWTKPSPKGEVPRSEGTLDPEGLTDLVVE